VDKRFSVMQPLTERPSTPLSVDSGHQKISPAALDHQLRTLGSVCLWGSLQPTAARASMDRASGESGLLVGKGHFRIPLQDCYCHTAKMQRIITRAHTEDGPLRDTSASTTSFCGGGHVFGPEKQFSHQTAEV
jgi:hypothetical protein